MNGDYMLKTRRTLKEVMRDEGSRVMDKVIDKIEDQADRRPIVDIALDITVAVVQKTGDMAADIADLFRDHGPGGTRKWNDERRFW